MREPTHRTTRCPTHRLAVAACILGLAGTAHAAPFKPCDDAASKAALNGSLCAIDIVPGDPSGAAGGSAPSAAPVSLFVRKFPSPGPTRGQVWLIAGGPGESGASFYALVPELRQAFPDFDLVMPDHRGTGFSTRLCPDEEAPGSAGGAALAGAEWASCFQRLNEQPAYARQFAQTNAAHDLKRLLERTPRQGQTFLYGVSYGTQLVLRTLALGADGIDGVVLDSLVPLQDDATADLSRRSLVTDAVGRAWLARCDADAHCRAALGEPAESAYRRLLARLEGDPALNDAVPGKNLRRLFGAMLDVPFVADTIPYIVKDMNEGSTAALQGAIRKVEWQAAKLGAFAQSPPSIPLVSIISASENNLRPQRTAQDVKTEEKDLLFVSALPALLVEPGLPTYRPDAWYNTLPRQLPRTLVIQSALDPKTPHAAAMRHVEALRKAGPVAVTTVENGAHFVLWAMPACFTPAVRAFVRGDARPAPRCDLRTAVTGT